MVFITVFTASLLGVQHERVSVEDKPASSLVVSLIGSCLCKDRQWLGLMGLQNRPKYKILCLLDGGATWPGA